MASLIFIGFLLNIGIFYLTNFKNSYFKILSSFYSSSSSTYVLTIEDEQISSVTST